MTMDEESVVFIATLHPFHDGSGDYEIIGVYSLEEKAQARCWRKLKELGYDQPTEVIECPLDKDWEGVINGPNGAPARSD